MYKSILLVDGVTQGEQLAFFVKRSLVHLRWDVLNPVSIKGANQPKNLSRQY